MEISQYPSKAFKGFRKPYSRSHTFPPVSSSSTVKILFLINFNIHLLNYTAYSNNILYFSLSMYNLLVTTRVKQVYLQTNCYL